jgi:type II secretory ATPase GspE/PulE/Tfp pilus assembly ATPase PilB-like protein
MVVGPTGSGKTASYEILAETMTYLRECGDPNQTF